MNKKILLTMAAVALTAMTQQLSAQNWSLTGNAGTTATNFLGTTDAKDLKIRTNNAVRVTIKSNGKVGIGNAAPGAKLDIFSGTGTADTIPVINALVKKTGNFDIIAIQSASQPAPGYGIGNQALGNYIGAVGLGGSIGLYGSSAGYSDTTVATGAEADGVSGVAGPAAFSLGVYGVANAGNYNYGVYGENNGLASDTAGSKRWAGYFYGDAFAIRFFQASDNRLKKNIEPITGALDKLAKVQTSYYDFKTTENPKMPLPSGKQIGFLAENMQQVFPELVKVSVVPRIVNKNREVVHESETFRSINYINMIPVVVAAVNEQQEIIKQKDQQLAEANARITKLESEMAEIKSMLQANNAKAMSSESAYLMQNTPNPSNGTTQIKFYLPQNSTGFVQVIDVTGKVIKSVKVAGSGMNQIDLNTNQIANGSYTYQLVIDNKVVDSKSMVVTK